MTILIIILVILCFIAIARLSFRTGKARGRWAGWGEANRTWTRKLDKEVQELSKEHKVRMNKLRRDLLDCTPVRIDTVNGYRIHVYEKNNEGFIGHADHADGRKIYSTDEPNSLGNFLESAKTVIVRDALMKREDKS